MGKERIHDSYRWVQNQDNCKNKEKTSQIKKELFWIFIILIQADFFNSNLSFFQVSNAIGTLHCKPLE